MLTEKQSRHPCSISICCSFVAKCAIPTKTALLIEAKKKIKAPAPRRCLDRSLRSFLARRADAVHDDHFQRPLGRLQPDAQLFLLMP
jgi:hypothetical protein